VSIPHFVAPVLDDRSIGYPFYIWLAKKMWASESQWVPTWSGDEEVIGVLRRGHRLNAGKRIDTAGIYRVERVEPAGRVSLLGPALAESESKGEHRAAAHELGGSDYPLGRGVVQGPEFVVVAPPSPVLELRILLRDVLASDLGPAADLVSHARPSTSDSGNAQWVNSSGRVRGLPLSRSAILVAGL
jgi:hypothetical protein